MRYRATKDTYYINLLLARLRRLLIYATSGLFARGLEKEDLLQYAYIGAWQAIQKWDRSKGELKYFILLCARREILSEVKKHTRKRIDQAAISIETILENAETANETKKKLSDRIGPEEILLEKERRDEIEERLLGKLSDLEKKVLLMRLNRKPYKQISRELKVGEKSIDNALWRIRKKIKRHLLTNKEEEGHV